MPAMARSSRKKWRRTSSKLRRVVTITMDQLGCFMAMLLTRELGAVVVFLNLWISLGNGIRF
ncbi:MAG: hypothetical protein B7Z83_06260, partial [Thiomonas sp. 20-64-5]